MTSEEKAAVYDEDAAGALLAELLTNDGPGTVAALVKVFVPATTCRLRASRVCTGCAHSRHGECRVTVKCPTTGAVNPCDCCAS